MGSKRQKNIFDNMFDRVDDISKDVRRAGRRSFGSRKKNKSGSTRKLARRNNEQLRALTEQMALLVTHLSARQQVDTVRDTGRVTVPPPPIDRMV